MNDKAIKIFGIINLLAFLGCILFSVIMGGCSSPVELASGSTMPMKCHWTFLAVPFVSLIGVIESVIMLIAKDKNAVFVSACLSIVTVVVAFLLMTNFGIGVCGHSDAHCHSTRIAVSICSAVALLSSIVVVAKARKAENNIEVPSKTL